MIETDAYKGQMACGWTRIDMLLELYDAIVESLAQAEDAQAKEDDPRLTREMVRAQRFMFGIIAGIRDGHDTAGEIERLCHFTLDRINQRDFAAARRIFSILKEAFEGISEQAHELEQTGVIPRLEEHRGLNVTA